jgi:hypothetical protein
MHATYGWTAAGWPASTEGSQGCRLSGKPDLWKILTIPIGRLISHCS